ncbi:MAG: TetR/AcrR family transcriptional regulator [Pseudomonadota bacterium]
MAQTAADTRFSSKRDQVLKAAAQCFNVKGFSGTALKDVADKLGLTDAALYYYVKNKEELVYLCYLRAVDVGWEALSRAIHEGGSGFEIVQRYFDYHIEVMVGDEGPVAILSEIPSLRPDHRDEILELSRRHSLRFEELLRQGIDDGSIRDCDIRMTGNAIMGSLNWIPKWYHGDDDMAEQVRAEFPRILGAGLSTRQ